MPSSASSTYQRLREFIAQRQRISYIDQPRMPEDSWAEEMPGNSQPVAGRGPGPPDPGKDVSPIENTTECESQGERDAYDNGISRDRKAWKFLDGLHKQSFCSRPGKSKTLDNHGRRLVRRGEAVCFNDRRTLAATNDCCIALAPCRMKA